LREWDDIAVAESMSSYKELESFVREAGREQGIDIDAPFPFLMSETAREIVWHINVDRTEGQPITRGAVSEIQAEVHVAR
jgi:acetolactate decarboxylase